MAGMARRAATDPPADRRAAAAERIETARDAARDATRAANRDADTPTDADTPPA